MIKVADQKHEVRSVCSDGINLFRILATYLKPVLPLLAERTESFLNIEPLNWESLNSPLLDHRINEFQPMLNRIDPKAVAAMVSASMTPAEPDTKPDTKTSISTAETQSPSDADYISIDDFAKIDLRVALIINAEAVEGAEKLLKLTLDVGDEQRTVFSGIKSAYLPGELIGKRTVLVANLRPRTMKFGVSQGMVLAAGPGGKDIFLIEADPGASAGMKVT